MKTFKITYKNVKTPGTEPYEIDRLYTGKELKKALKNFRKSFPTFSFKSQHV